MGSVVLDFWGGFLGWFGMELCVIGGDDWLEVMILKRDFEIVGIS